MYADHIQRKILQLLVDWQNFILCNFRFEFTTISKVGTV